MTGGKFDIWFVLAAGAAIMLACLIPGDPAVKIPLAFIGFLIVSFIAYVATGRDRDLK